jgi:hypothetical protein
MTLRAGVEVALCLVELRGFEPLTPCMPCSVGLLPHTRSEAGARPDHRLRVTVIVRWIPLVTAACGTWVARPVSRMMLRTRRRWLPARPQGEARPR